MQCLGWFGFEGWFDELVTDQTKDQSWLGDGTNVLSCLTKYKNITIINHVKSTVESREYCKDFITNVCASH